MKRGYVILFLLVGVIFLAGMAGMHWSFVKTALIGAGGVLMCTGTMTFFKRK